MKKIKTITAIFLVLCIFLTGCSSGNDSEEILDQNNNSSEIPEVFITPEEEYVIKCLEQVDTVNGIAAVTEENDPNNKLNKKDGYISAVYFSSSLIRNNKLSERQLIEEGTSAGGCIEVYSTEKNANKRNEYLAGFDGGILGSGSHTVIGTVVVRLSSELDKTQQKKFEKEIINAFITSNDELIVTEKETLENYTGEETKSSTEIETTEINDTTTKTETTSRKNVTTTTKTETTSRKSVTTTKKAENTTKKNNNTPSLTTQAAKTRYVLNTNSHIFHYGTCHHAKKIVPENRIETNQSRDEVVANGYRACGVCKP